MQKRGGDPQLVRMILYKTNLNIRCKWIFTIPLIICVHADEQDLIVIDTNMLVLLKRKNQAVGHQWDL